MCVCVYIYLYIYIHIYICSCILLLGRVSLCINKCRYVTTGTTRRATSACARARYYSQAWICGITRKRGVPVISVPEPGSWSLEPGSQETGSLAVRYAFLNNTLPISLYISLCLKASLYYPGTTRRATSACEDALCWGTRCRTTAPSIKTSTRSSTSGPQSWSHTMYQLRWFQKVNFLTKSSAYCFN